MNAELKAKWIAALRSGKYRQGFGGLVREDGSVCAMGVLCKIARRGTTDRAYAWLRKIGVRYDLFMDLNDAQGKSFATIADYIDQHIPADERPSCAS